MGIRGGFKMAIRSKQIKEDEDLVYCRRCQQYKSPKNFYSAIDTEIDRNGRFSVCSDCIDEMYNFLFESSHSMEKSILSLCRSLNVLYNQDAVDAARQHIETMKSNGKNVTSVFGIYKNKISVTSTGQIGNRDVVDLTYKDNPSIIINQESVELEDGELASFESLKEFWGGDYTLEEYRWLDGEAGRWRKKHKIDTRSEESLLQLIVLKLFDIRRARQAGKDTSSLEKAYQEMLKTSALAPSMASDANSGENLDTYGKKIELMEKYEPAQFFEGEEGKQLYKDFGGVEYYGGMQYIDDYLNRSMKNTLLQTKDFNLLNESGEEEMDINNELSDEEVNDADQNKLSE